MYDDGYVDLAFDLYYTSRRLGDFSYDDGGSHLSLDLVTLAVAGSTHMVDLDLDLDVDPQ